MTKVRVAKLLNHKGIYTVILTTQNEKKEEQDLYPDPDWSFNSWSDTGKSKLPLNFSSPDGKVSIKLTQESETFSDMFQRVSSLFG